MKNKKYFELLIGAFLGVEDNISINVINFDHGRFYIIYNKSSEPLEEPGANHVEVTLSDLLGFMWHNSLK